jgi:hypothetical protein
MTSLKDIDIILYGRCNLQVINEKPINSTWTKTQLNEIAL